MKNIKSEVYRAVISFLYVCFSALKTWNGLKAYQHTPKLASFTMTMFALWHTYSTSPLKKS